MNKPGSHSLGETALKWTCPPPSLHLGKVQQAGEATRLCKDGSTNDWELSGPPVEGVSAQRPGRCLGRAGGTPKCPSGSHTPAQTRRRRGSGARRWWKMRSVSTALTAPQVVPAPHGEATLDGGGEGAHLPSTQSVPLSTKPVSHRQPSCWADVGQGGLSAGAGTRGAAELVVAVGRAHRLWRKTDES